jgi:hypothetical protein
MTGHRGPDIPKTVIFYRCSVEVGLGSANAAFSLVSPGQWTISVTNPANPNSPSAAFAFTVVSQ